MDTSNGILKQTLLSNWNLLVVAPTMDTSIDGRIATCGGDYHTLLMPATKEVISDMVRGSMQVNQTHVHVKWTVRDDSTPGNAGIDSRSTQDHSPVLIEIPAISPSCDIGWSLQVGKKLQSTSPDEIRNAQNWTLPLI